MFEIFSLWFRGQQKAEPPKTPKNEANPNECFTYVCSSKKEQKINLEDYYVGNKNDYYKTLVSTDNGRSDVDKCLLYAQLPKLLKILASRHSSPSGDVYILRFNCSPDKVIEAIKSNSFHLTLVEAYDYFDIWKRQNIDAKLPIKTFPNNHLIPPLSENSKLKS